MKLIMLGIGTEIAVFEGKVIKEMIWRIGDFDYF